MKIYANFRNDDDYRHGAPKCEEKNPLIVTDILLSDEKMEGGRHATNYYPNSLRIRTDLSQAQYNAGINYKFK